MDYSPFHPVVWGLFLGFALLTRLIVYFFQKKNPGYPQPNLYREESKVEADLREPRRELGAPKTGLPS